MMLRSVRARITAWYVGALALVLVVLAAGSYLAAVKLLNRRADAALLATLKETKLLLADAPAQSGQELAARLAAAEVAPAQAVWVLDADGKAVAAKAATGARLRLPEMAAHGDGRPHFYSLGESHPDADDGCRGVFQRIAVAAPPGSYTVVVAQSNEAISDQLDLLQNVALVLVPLVLLLAATGGWFLARRSLAPIAEMAEAAHGINASHPEDRLPVSNPQDELGSLATEFNQVLDRLAAALTQQRQFMADASHELRTPLSVVRTAAEVALGKAEREETEYRETLAIVRDQALRLSQVVDGLFALARDDMGQSSAQIADFYLDETAMAAVRSVSVLAAKRDQRIDSRIPGDLPYRGDEGLIRQMLVALLDNAVKYTPAGGLVAIAIEPRRRTYVLRISDTGPGIPAADQAHIFERFFRSKHAPPSGAGDQGGAGLGLAIARSIALQHRGEIRLERSDRTGSVFAITLPRS